MSIVMQSSWPEKHHSYHPLMGKLNMIKRTASEWIAESLDLKTVVMIVVLVGGWVANWAHQQSQLTDHERRILMLETQIVPKDVHAVRDRELDRRLDALDSRFEKFDSMIQEVLSEVRINNRK